MHLQIQSKTLTKLAYILRATDANKELLSPSASTHAAKRGYWHGNFLLMNGTMDDLAYVLATGLENPVLNETGIDGTYDARFKVAGEDVDSLNAILKETLGLEIVPGQPGDVDSRTRSEQAREEQAVPINEDTRGQVLRSRIAINRWVGISRAKSAYENDLDHFRVTGKRETIVFLPGKSAFDKLPEWHQN